jgi:LPPG:FO 2-phospho-L-lactate transferase
MDGKVLALAGGTGGAKLALGLARVLPPEQLVIVVNTGDDECFHGLHVSPDLDTIMYTLAGLVNQETGWGLAGDTFKALGMLRIYDADTWFNLGDLDLATHVRRTQLLGQGLSLSQVTNELCRRLGVEHQVVPMSDGPVRTVLSTDGGDLPMQTYFVRHRSEPKVSSIAYVGAESAEASPSFSAAMAEADLVVFCPSNPFLSVGPILAVPGVRENMAQEPSSQLRVGVSPIVGGSAIKGPAAKIMSELGHEVSCVGVAKIYQDICDVFVMDVQDRALALEIQELGITPLVTSTIMETEEDKIALAREILALVG